MNTTNQYLDAVKARYCLASDYAIAKKIGISHQAVYKLRSGKSAFDESTALHVAQLLEIDPSEAVLRSRMDQEKRPEIRAIWEGIFAKLGGVAAASLLAVGLAGLPTPGEANTVQKDADGICIMLSRHAKRRRKSASPFSIFGQLLLAH